jgi:hypothetical protein
MPRHTTLDDTKAERSDEYQHAIDLCNDVVEAIYTGDLAHARTVLAEAQAVLGDTPTAALDSQERREAGWDCYD